MGNRLTRTSYNFGWRKCKECDERGVDHNTSHGNNVAEGRANNATNNGITFPDENDGGGGGGFVFPSRATMLTVVALDQMTRDNATRHKTDEYHVTERTDGKARLVVRRGQKFTLRVTLDREYDADNDVVCLVFTAKGTKSPSYSDGSQVSVPVLPDTGVSSVNAPEDNVWTATLVKSTGNPKLVTISVIPAVNSIVGEWTLDVDTKLGDNSVNYRRFTHPHSIYMLFNPWSPYDTVYMSEDDKRDEYILNDSGLIWRGTHSRIRATPWAYGQFDEDVLEACVYLLTDVGHLAPSSRADPIAVSRHLSAVTNVQDDEGVVVGNWTGDYGGGRAPTSWSGSSEILRKFLKNKKPVEFGQCWIFAGVLATACRALGIPCRVVTNYESAHDTHSSLTVDIFCSKDGEVLKDVTKDSVWNFHVWNEVWMQRPDLEPGDYGGWQAIDSTPQEASDGAYRCGPASVRAIRRGEIRKPYDGAFLFAEVNADKVYWLYQGNMQPFKLLQKLPESIGLIISTKAVGRFAREDITDSYKHAEKSKEEREVMLSALRLSNNMYSRYYLNEVFEDVQFDFQLLDDIVIGSPFHVALRIKNKNQVEKTYDLSAILRVYTMSYTGKPERLVRKSDHSLSIESGKDEVIEIEIPYDEYSKRLSEQASFHISASATVKDTGFQYFAQDDFRVRMPDISLETKGDLIQNEPFTLIATLENPLPRPLTAGVFYIQGASISEPIKKKVPGSIKAGEKATATFVLTPKHAGEKSVVAKFVCKELKDVDGFLAIDVKANMARELSNEIDTSAAPNGQNANGCD